jgi:NAD(P)-dependent dehydrogenase (short-subunit alcohol dehydrogenase family)
MDVRSPQTGRLQGRKAVIVGAGTHGNIGQTIARRFLDEGAQVIVAGRDREELSAFAEASGCSWRLFDMTDPASIAAMSVAARAQMGGIDIAVNATGWGLMKPFLDTTPEEIDAMNVLQLRGPFVFYQEMIRGMTEGGSILQISSIVATIMCHDHAAYMATKAATDHLIRIVANEFGENGIRANSISPALTATPMARDFMGAAKAYIPQFPLGRIGTAEDIAAAAVWLASEECFMTGENLQVNGGFTLRRHPTKSEIAATGVKLPYLQE